MNIEIQKDNWQNFFKEFGKNNYLRPAKLEIIDESGPQTEIDIMPFNGIDLDLKAGGAPVVNLSFGDEKSGGRHLYHNVENVKKIFLKSDSSGNDEVLELEDNNRKTLIIFQELPEIGTEG